MKSLINKHGLVFVIVISAIMRLVSINQSLWLDEATTAMVASGGLINYFTNFVGNDFHPPFYYLCLVVLSKVFGNSEFVLRSLSLFSGIGTVVLVYLISKTLNDNKHKLFPFTSSLFVATSGLHIYYSQEARMYSLATFLVSLSVFFYIKKRRLLFEISIALMAMTHYLTIFVLVVYPFYIFATKGGWREWRKYLTSLRLLVVVLFLWSGYFFTQLTNGLGVENSAPAWWNILGRTTPKEVGLVISKFIFGRVSIEDNLLYGIVTFLVGVIFFLIIFQGVKGFRTVAEIGKNKYLLIYIWLILPIILSALIGFFIPVFSYFRLLFVLPAFYIVLSLGLLKMGRKWSMFAVFFVLSVNIISSCVYIFNSKFHREDWRSFVGFVESDSRNSIVLFVANSQMEAYRYYAKDVVAISPDQLNSGFDTIWLMRYVYDIYDPKSLVQAQIEEMGYLKDSEYNFNGVNVWKYKISQ